MKRLGKMMMLMLLVVFMSVSCTQEQRAKNWGGSYDYELPVNQKLVDVTWKGDDTWVLYRDMRENEKAETYTYVQQKGKVFSLTGSGTIIFIESKTK